MRIKFVVAYRGVLTGERFYPANTVVEMDDATARALIEAGRATRSQDAPQWGQAPALPDRLWATDLVRPEWIGPLGDLGITSLEALAGTEAATLARVKGIGPKTAVRLIERAKDALKG